jgi:hypothetical protein
MTKWDQQEILVQWENDTFVLNTTKENEKYEENVPLFERLKMNGNLKLQIV